MTSTSFASLPLHPALLANLDSLDYRQMTPVQAQSLPPMLAGRDIRAQAKTGSGKTAAFGLCLLHKLDPGQFRLQALVICPTRELAEQVSQELRRLARPLANVKILALCGGKALGPQLASLEHQPHIVVGTPGRLLKHLGMGSLKTEYLHTLVLDEADRMLDMGFLDDIRLIVEQLPTARQTLLFSATYPQQIDSISETIQQQPVSVQADSLHDASVISQDFHEVAQDAKTSALISLLLHYQPESALVFCNRKQQCQEVCKALQEAGFHAIALEGDMDQKERDMALLRFANKSINILIATDVAARGLDIKELALVCNYELPHDPEVYVHRIGRTGRAGSAGKAVSLFAATEVRKLQAIEEFQQQTLVITDIPAQQGSKPAIPAPLMTTLSINSGRKNKLRPGDILGALTAGQFLGREDIGKIDIGDFASCVAVRREVATRALRLLNEGGIKGKKVKARKL